MSEQKAEAALTHPNPAVAGRADPEGNGRLTALTGTVLLVLLAAEIVTTLLLGTFFGLHFFLGMVLIGPVCLKIGSTLWRFGRYYLGSQPYVRRGPPPMPQRIMGPVLVLTSAGVLGTGVILAVTGPDLSGRARWLLLVGSLIGGLILAVLTYHLRARWGSWGGNIL